MRKQNHSTDQLIQDPYMLCWCAKWQYKKTIHSSALIDFSKHYKKNPTCDKKIIEKLWDLIDKADIIVGQNSNRYDLKWINQVFLKHDILPPSPYQKIDTLTESRKNFFCMSHSLDYRTKQLGLKGKTKHDGFDMWIKCINGDKKAWSDMVKYCKNDVRILEKYYLKLRPYMKSHPNVNISQGHSDEIITKCIACGSSDLIYQGYRLTNGGKYHKKQCKNCGKWMSNKKNLIKVGHVGI